MTSRLVSILKIRGIAGSHIRDIAADMMRLAKLLDVMVECEINGTRLLATKASTEAEMRADYELQLKEGGR